MERASEMCKCSFRRPVRSGRVVSGTKFAIFVRMHIRLNENEQKGGRLHRMNRRHTYKLLIRLLRRKYTVLQFQFRLIYMQSDRWDIRDPFMLL